MDRVTQLLEGNIYIWDWLTVHPQMWLLLVWSCGNQTGVCRHFQVGRVLWDFPSVCPLAGWGRWPRAFSQWPPMAPRPRKLWRGQWYMGAKPETPPSVESSSFGCAHVKDVWNPILLVFPPLVCFSQSLCFWTLFGVIFQTWLSRVVTCPTEDKCLCFGAKGGDVLRHVASGSPASLPPFQVTECSITQLQSWFSPFFVTWKTEKQSSSVQLRRSGG